MVRKGGVLAYDFTKPFVLIKIHFTYSREKQLSKRLFVITLRKADFLKKIVVESRGSTTFARTSRCFKAQVVFRHFVSNGLKAVKREPAPTSSSLCVEGAV